MKIVILGDTHWGIRNDSDQFADYFMLFYDNIVFPYMKKHNIDTIIQTGDFLDRRKGISYKTLHFISTRFMNVIEKNGWHIHMIPGNHDIYYRHSNEVNSITELFSWMKNVHIYNEPTTVKFDSSTIDFIPWMNKQNFDDYLKFIEASDSECCVGHFEIDGFEMYSGVAGHGTLSASAFSKYKRVISGHYHHKSTKKNITYVGTPYEMTWSDFNDPRGFHVYDTETNELTFVKNPFSMFVKVFFDSDMDYSAFDFSVLKDKIVKIIVQNRSNPAIYEWFVNEAEKAAPIDLSIVDSDVIAVHGVDQSEFDSIDVLTTLIESAKLTAQNNSLKSDVMAKLVKTVYAEAIEKGRMN